METHLLTCAECGNKMVIEPFGMNQQIGCKTCNWCNKDVPFSRAHVKEFRVGDFVALLEAVGAVFAAEGVGFDCPICPCGYMHTEDCPLNNLKRKFRVFEDVL